MMPPPAICENLCNLWTTLAFLKLSSCLPSMVRVLFGIEIRGGNPMITTTIGTAKAIERPSHIPKPGTPFAQATLTLNPSPTPLPSVSIRVHPWPFHVLPRTQTVLSLCAKKTPKTHKRGGNEPEYLRKIRCFSPSNQRIFEESRTFPVKTYRSSNKSALFPPQIYPKIFIPHPIVLTFHANPFHRSSFSIHRSPIPYPLDPSPSRPPQLRRPRSRISLNFLLRRHHRLPRNRRINPSPLILLERLLHPPILPRMKRNNRRPPSRRQTGRQHPQQIIQIRQFPIHQNPQRLKSPRRRMQFRPRRSLQRKIPRLAHDRHQLLRPRHRHFPPPLHKQPRNFQPIRLIPQFQKRLRQILLRNPR